MYQNHTKNEEVCIENDAFCSRNVFGDCEEHINADISIAARQMWLLSHDKEWLKDTGYPLARGIARFWA